jgi:hypothetical protein
MRRARECPDCGLGQESNIFAGFTPLELEPHNLEKDKAKQGSRSLLFTLEHPRNVSAR